MRLDALVVERGLAPSRARARGLILAGQVRVDDVVRSKAGTPVSSAARVSLTRPDHGYVGRGGVKLAHALDAFGIPMRGRLVLDIGASTGGFTDAALQRGARRVAAVDVGRGQIAWKLRQDPRVAVLDGVNARYLDADRLPADLRRFDVVTIDVSFISVTRILPAVPPLVAEDGDVVVLVKPQFEAGRPEIGKRGVVRDPAVRRRVVDHVAAAGAPLGWTCVAATPSPVAGAEGNREVFLHFRLRAKSPPGSGSGSGTHPGAARESAP